jgi:hypothetical protein
MLAIGCGYPDGNDLDWLRRDPAFKLACGRLPDSGALKWRRIGRLSRPRTTLRALADEVIE